MIGSGKKKAKVDRLATAYQWVQEAGASSSAINLPKGVNFWDPSEDKAYTISIVAYDVTDAMDTFTDKRAKPGQLYYERSYHVHRYIGPEGSKRSFVCSAKTFGKKRAICEWLNEISSPDDDKETKEAIKKMWAKPRQLWNVYVHDEPQKGVQIWDISYYLFGENLQEKMKKAEPEKREKYMRFHDPESGYFLRLEPKQEAMGANKFLDFTGIEFKCRKEPISSKLLAKAVNLDELIKMPVYKEVKAFLAGMNDKSEEDETEPDEDEDEDDTVDSELEEEDDDEPVVKKKPKKKPKPEDEEDEDGEEDEEDEGDDEEDEDEDEESEDDDDGDGEDDAEEDEEPDEESDEDDNDGDEDDDGDDDESEEDEGDKLVKGNKVSYIRKGKKKVGKITSINYKNGMAAVILNGAETAISVKIEKLTLEGGKAKPSLEDDEDDDDDVPLPAPKKKKKPGK